MPNRIPNPMPNPIIDLHTHTLLSDGALLTSELTQRALTAGYQGIAITDHVDTSNMEDVIEKTLNFTGSLPPGYPIRVVPGVELTHVPPSQIGALAEKARALGARVVLCHGETISEPVAPGTNLAAIEAKVDILAHPGLITLKEAELSATNSVLLEISARKGHCLCNGHVASISKETGAGLVINSDAHGPEDLLGPGSQRRVALGAGLTEEDYEEISKNAVKFIEKISS